MDGRTDGWAIAYSALSIYAVECKKPDTRLVDYGRIKSPIKLI